MIKRLNILIHGIQEDNNNVWEKREKTTEKFQDFLKNGLKIDSNEIKLSDIYRLPQQPITKNGKTVHQPIIVKLLTIHDKNLIVFPSVINKELQNLSIWFDSNKLTVNPFKYNF